MCAACGAESVVRHAGTNNNDLEYWVECSAHPQKHRTSCFKTAREAATRWNARQKTLRAYKPVARQMKLTDSLEKEEMDTSSVSCADTFPSRGRHGESDADG